MLSKTTDDNRFSLIVLVLSVILSFLIIKVLILLYNKVSGKLWFMLHLSDVTYEIYLVHVAIIYILKKFMAHEWYAYIIVYVMSIIVAFVIKNVSTRYLNIVNILINK